MYIVYKIKNYLLSNKLDSKLSIYSKFDIYRKYILNYIQKYRIYIFKLYIETYNLYFIDFYL